MCLGSLAMTDYLFPDLLKHQYWFVFNSKNSFYSLLSEKASSYLLPPCHITSLLIHPGKKTSFTLAKKKTEMERGVYIGSYFCPF